MSAYSPRQVQPGLHVCPNPTRQRGIACHCNEPVSEGHV
ncbi:DUF1589 domain-containing protein [Rhodopirellula europaea]